MPLCVCDLFFHFCLYLYNLNRFQTAMKKWYTRYNLWWRLSAWQLFRPSSLRFPSVCSISAVWNPINQRTVTPQIKPILFPSLFSCIDRKSFLPSETKADTEKVDCRKNTQTAQRTTLTSGLDHWQSSVFLVHVLSLCFIHHWPCKTVRVSVLLLYRLLILKFNKKIKQKQS